MKLAAFEMPSLHGRDYFVAGVGLMLLVIASLVAFSHWMFGVTAGWTGENGVLELTQQVLLAVAGLVFAASTVFDAHEKITPERSLVFAALCVTFLLRETDVADPTRLAWLSYWLDASGKKVLLVVTWLLVIFFTAATRTWPSVVRRNFVFDRPFWLLAGAAAALSVSWAIDREHVLLRNGMAIEEISEVLAYGLMVLAAIQLFRQHAGLTAAASSQN